MKPALASCLWLFLFAQSPLAGAAISGADSREFQVMLEGRAIGRAVWSWNAESFEDSVTLELVHGSRPAQASFRSVLQKTQEGIVVTNDVVQGRSRQHEQVRIEEGPPGLMPDDLARRMAEIATNGLSGSRLNVVDPHSMAVRPMQASACNDSPPRSCAMLGGKKWRFDADGKLVSVERDVAGLPVLLVACAGRCDGAVQRLDLLDRLSVSSPLRIPRESAQRKLRFVLSRKDGRAPILATTDDQEVVFDGNRAIVTVCRRCASRERPSDAVLAAAARPNAWLQSSAPVYRRLSAKVGGKSSSVDARMRRSVRIVESQLNAVRTFVGYADAVQALKIRQADCMGYAVVLAALARAQGIPARIVVGMAYADRFSGRTDVFTPHAWVQAWDGERWASYDAALGDFDSTHIALAVGNGAPGEVAEAFGQLDRLRVEKIGVVKPD